MTRPNHRARWCRLLGHKTHYMGARCLRCGAWYVFGEWRK